MSHLRRSSRHQIARPSTGASCMSSRGRRVLRVEPRLPQHGAPSAGRVAAPIRLAEGQAVRGVRLQETGEQVHERRRHVLCHRARAPAQLPLLHVGPEAVPFHILEALAAARAGGEPWVVLHQERIDRHADGEGVRKKAVVLLGQVHLGRLVGRLAADAVLEDPPRRGHAEVDDLYAELVVGGAGAENTDRRSLPREQNVLQAQVAVHQRVVVQPPDRVDDLPDQGTHPGLPLRTGHFVGDDAAPREEVALGGEFGDHVRGARVAVDAQQLATIRVRSVVQELRAADVPPRMLRLERVHLHEVVVVVTDPIVWHRLHCDPSA
mmetsp:Transcript_12786/g.45290  ORF Transcript_12786/g.45290 Transcript_12786/m.45290 type:complete len:322 (+) Transcript_12786:197-1162(+)